MKNGNLFANLGDCQDKEIFSELTKGKNFKLKRIISCGQTSAKDDWYNQKQSEWVILLKGSARLEFENNRFLDLKPGDYVYIPAGCRHRVDQTDRKQKTIWLAIYYQE